MVGRVGEQCACLRDGASGEARHPIRYGGARHRFGHRRPGADDRGALWLPGDRRGPDAAFRETARALSDMCGMADRVRFEVGSAVALPLPDASFDLALLLHVGMNVPDKAALFREARRVLREGGTFALYEVMRTGDGDLSFPVPWAETPDLSALETPAGLSRCGEAAGFALRAEENRREVALDFFSRLQSSGRERRPAAAWAAQSDGSNREGEGGQHDRARFGQARLRPSR